VPSRFIFASARCRLTRRLRQDAAERCRLLAVESVLLLVQHAPAAVLSLLPYAVPVLRERLLRPRGACCPEPSEARTRCNVLAA
jgi:hypothetical protein